MSAGRRLLARPLVLGAAVVVIVALCAGIAVVLGRDSGHDVAVQARSEASEPQTSVAAEGRTWIVEAGTGAAASGADGQARSDVLAPGDVPVPVKVPIDDTNRALVENVVKAFPDGFEVVGADITRIDGKLGVVDILNMSVASPSGITTEVLVQQLTQPVSLDAITLGRPGSQYRKAADGETVTLAIPEGDYKVSPGQTVFAVSAGGRMVRMVEGPGAPVPVRFPLSAEELSAVAVRVANS